VKAREIPCDGGLYMVAVVGGFASNETVTVTVDGDAYSRNADRNGYRIIKWSCDTEPWVTHNSRKTLEFEVWGERDRQLIEFEVTEVRRVR